MNSLSDSIKAVARILLVAASALVPIVPESAFATLPRRRERIGWVFGRCRITLR